jgi:O-antigen ligase
MSPPRNAKPIPVRTMPVEKRATQGLWSLSMIGLCIFTISIVTYKFPLAELGIAIGAVGLLVGAERVRFAPAVWLLALFIAWALLASMFARFPQITQAALFERAKLLPIFLIAINALRTWRHVRVYLILLLVCFILFPVRGALINYFFVGYTVFGRAIWNFVYGNPNDLAVLCLLALGAALALALRKQEHKYVRWGAWAATGLLLFTMLLTQSRGAFLGLLVGMGWPIAKNLLREPRRIVVAVVGVVLLVSVTPSTVWQRLAGISKLTSVETIGQADAEGSAQQRFELQGVAWKIFSDHPLFGIGLGAYRPVNAQYAPKLGPRDTHNTYLNLAAELGLPGLLIWVALVVSVLARVRRARRSSLQSTADDASIWVERGFVGFLVASIFGTYSVLTMPYLILAVLWCLVTDVPREPSDPRLESQKRKR